MNFKKLLPSDYSKLKKFFVHQQYELSAYSLTSIIAWSTEFFHPRGAVDGDTLFVGAEFTKTPDRRHLIMPISINSEYSPEKLYRIAADNGYNQFFFVPENYVSSYGVDYLSSFFVISEQSAFRDYVYLTSDLAKLDGNKYSKKRNLINQFCREFVARKHVTAEPITKDVANECIDFLEEWCEERKCDKESDRELYCEKRAAINTIENIDLLGVDSLLLRIDGKVSAFGMASRLTPHMGIFHFEKAFSKIKGLYQYFDNLCAIKLFRKYTYINKESDMDIPGLAKAKRSYHPVMMIKSFRLVLI